MCSDFHLGGGAHILSHGEFSLKVVTAAIKTHLPFPALSIPIPPWNLYDEIHPPSPGLPF